MWWWGGAAWAADPVDEVRLRFTLVEAPDVWAPRPTWPTMDVSLGLAVGVDRLAVLGVHSFYDAAFPHQEGLRKGLGIATAGALAGGLVFVNAWAHEEWHRAVLSRAGASSRNGLYHPGDWSNGLIAVDRVSDEALSSFKREHPADYVRMSSAGMEAQYAIGRRLGDEAFFGDGVGERWGALYLADTWLAPTLVANELSVALYDLRCADEANDEVTDAENRLRLDVPSRDFTGLDCTAWVYDLRRPDQPYEARGPHPYGAGVDRYRSWVGPHAGRAGLPRGPGAAGPPEPREPPAARLHGGSSGATPAGGARLGQVATPWGHRVDAVVAFRGPSLRGTATLHSGFARAGWFPGVGLTLVEHPLAAGLSVDAELDLWLQPADQRWDEAARAPGGRLRADLNLPVTRGFAVSPGLDLKSQGFVVGLPTVEPVVLGRLGVVAELR
jgi:hypothetical protein